MANYCPLDGREGCPDKVACKAAYGTVCSFVADPDIPPVPTPAQCERERFEAELRREQAELEAMRMEPLEDYNAFEEQQVFLDNEGGW